MLHSVTPTGGFTAQHPRPSWLPGGPPDTAHRPTSLGLGQEGGLGVMSPVPPTISLPSFQETPNHYWLRKLIVYKYPKLRTKRGWGRRKWHSAWTRRLAAGLSPPSLSCEERAPHPHLNPGAGWVSLLKRLFFFSWRKRPREKSTGVEEPRAVQAVSGGRGPAGCPGGRGAAATGLPSSALPVCKVHHEASTFLT